MLTFLSITYGIHLVLLIYLISYFSARGVVKGGVVPVIVTLGKYGAYYAAIVFGFKYLDGKMIMLGFVGALYVSLTGIALYYWRKNK